VQKEYFLAQLSSFRNGVLLPYIISGNFNILRRASEKNTPFIESHSLDLFNSIIHTPGLSEIFMHGGKYTWSNNHASPTLENLDRILLS
jgi:hypothetical protein